MEIYRVNNIFELAINELKKENIQFREPEMFQRYIKNNNLKAKGTASYISVQSFSDLNPELKENNLMVFRLGSRKGETGTYFSIVKIQNSWDDYFLFDESIFKNCSQITKTIDWSNEHYLSFNVIPKLTETSHVNLSLTAGILEESLYLDSNSISIPATGRGNYSFNVKPHSSLDATWKHNAGQVEIDSVFAGKRNGKKYLIIVEAKSGKYPDSLAKHKLMYPILAISAQVPSDYEIMPVYIRAHETKESITFYISECDAINPKNTPCINELTSNNASIIKINK